MRRHLATALVATVAATTACSSQGRDAAEDFAAAADYPIQRLDWTIAFGPGGGNDRLSRTLVDILLQYDLYQGPIVATNRPAGSGAQGWGYLYAHAGDPYQISSISGSFLTLPLQSDVPWTPADFTPVALLATDDLVLAVPRGSEVRDFGDFVSRSVRTPAAIGGVGSLGVDFMVVHRLGKAAGFEPRYVAFNEMGSLVTAALSRSLDAIVANPGEALGLLESGDLRALAFTGARTPEWLGNVPTFEEVGFGAAAIQMPRGIVLAPGVSREVRDWWIETIKKAVDTPEWRTFLETSLLSPDVRYGDDFAAHIEELSRGLAEVYAEMGALNR